MQPIFRAAGLAALFALALARPAHAQESVHVTVRVLHLDAPVAGATVRADGRSAVTGVRGAATLALAAGPHAVVIERLGFEPDTVRLDLAARDTAVTVQLREAAVSIAPVVVAASRSGTILQDQPVRVEAVPQEEIEENQTVAPGGLTTLLEELPGVQIQAAAPGLGGAGLSLRGLPARHSQVLIDGLPLLGAEPDAFALLQTPPLDLARVEVIKGVASALYGGSAIGGVLNLVSRGPTGDAMVLANAASPAAADLTAFAPIPLSPRWGATLTGGAHAQEAADVNDDGWADLPRVRRAEARPRLFWSGPRGSSVFATLGAMAETRAGGFVSGPSPRYRESVDTRRLDGGIVGHALLGAGMVLGGRGSLTHLHHHRAFGTEMEGDDETAGYAETTLGASAGVHTWLAGAALTYDALRSPDAPGAAYTYVTPAVFVQDELAASDAVRLSASARADFQDRYGTFVSPRLSALVRPGGGVALRASAGTGFATPHPLTDEVEAVGLRRLEPLRGLDAERAAGASLDAEWSGGGWELSASLFGSEIRHPLVAREDPADPARLRLMNLAGPTRRTGSAPASPWPSVLPYFRTLVLLFRLANCRAGALDSARATR
jgi:iron complex outermembrane receptor protein